MILGNHTRFEFVAKAVLLGRTLTSDEAGKPEAKRSQ